MELRVLVAMAEANTVVVHDPYATPAPAPRPLHETIIDVVSLWPIALAAIATIAVSIHLGSLATASFAVLQLFLIFTLRHVELERPWWRRWLYGVTLGALFVCV